MELNNPHREVPVVVGPRKKTGKQERVSARIDAKLYSLAKKKIPKGYDKGDTNAIMFGFTLLANLSPEMISKYGEKVLENGQEEGK